MSAADPLPAPLLKGQDPAAIVSRGKSAARWQRVFTLPNILTALFVGLCAPLIFTHALWVDEAQALVIARDSHSLGELLWNLRYEGHPPLWHLLLWFLTRLAPSIYVMQALHLLLAAASVYLVVRFSPFPPLAKILFPFGYFPLFEYGIISRNYQLVMLLTFAFCALWRYRQASYVWLGLLLALLCLSHALGVIIAAALGVMLLLDALVTPSGRHQITRHPFHFTVGLCLALAGATLSVYLLKPPPDYGYARVSVPRQEVVAGRAGAGFEDKDWYWQWDYRRAQVATSSLADGLLPIGRHQVHFWDTALTDTTPAATAEGIIIACVALLCFGTAWRAWLFYGIATLGLLLFSYLKFQGGTRHHGMLFITLIAGFWIAWTTRDPAATAAIHAAAKIPRRLLILFLAVQVYSAAIAVYFAWQVPFAAGRAAAQAVQKAMQPGDLLVADMEFVAPTISAYLPGHPLYVANTQSTRNFIVWLKGRPDSRPAGIEAARNYAREQNKPVIWITRAQGGRPIPRGGAGGSPTGVTLVGEFDGGGNSLEDATAIMGMETFAVFRIEP